jgi:hypothetical protein
MYLVGYYVATFAMDGWLAGVTVWCKDLQAVASELQLQLDSQHEWAGGCAGTQLSTARRTALPDRRSMQTPIGTS